MGVSDAPSGVMLHTPFSLKNRWSVRCTFGCHAAHTFFPQNQVECQMHLRVSCCTHLFSSKPGGVSDAPSGVMLHTPFFLKTRWSVRCTFGCHAAHTFPPKNQVECQMHLRVLCCTHLFPPRNQVECQMHLRVSCCTHLFP